MEGWLWKQGVGWKVWRKRWFVLNGQTLTYHGKPGAPAKNTLSLAGAIPGRVEKAKTGKDNSGRLITSGRILYFYAESPADLTAWLAVFTKACATPSPALEPMASPTASAASAASTTATSNASSSSSSSSSGGVLLPELLDIDGPPETGSELRLRADVPLETLCVAWFRYEGAALPGEDVDIGSLPGCKYIAGATQETYTVTEADIGKRIGAAVRPAVGRGVRWTVQADAATAVNLSTVSVRLQLVQHEHCKYCDRRVRVCTAVGRYREGEVLTRVLRGPADQFSKYTCYWYRSDVVDDSQLGSVISPRPAAAVLQGAPSESALADDDRDDNDSSSGRSTPSTPLPGTMPPLGSSTQRMSAMLDMSSVLYRRVDARPVSDLAPAPKDYEPSPSIPDMKARLTPRTERAEQPPGGFTAYPLFREDVGRMIMCALVPTGTEPPAVLRPHRRGGFNMLLGAPAEADDSSDAAAAAAAAASASSEVIKSLAVGPIEAGPPKAREIWIEGETRVGSLLQGNVYYFGGFQGASEVSWVAITDDGSTVEVKPPARCDPALPLPPQTSEAGGPGDADPRVLRLTPAQAGCLIKYRVKPVRSDGDEGHMESSRPTAEVQA